jgi:hypothetical protein
MIHQDQIYHMFADTRMFFGIPNFWNVVTNLPFIVVAIYGLCRLKKINDVNEMTNKYVILIATLMIGLGSSYYHWNPNDNTLLWDRLPMAIVFMGIVAATLKRFYGSLVCLGIGSVLWWHFTGELLPYVIVQFGALLLVTIFDWKRLWAVIMMYAIAKVHEHFDHQIYQAFPLSGHSMKHLFAAAAILTYINLTMVARKYDDLRHE